MSRPALTALALGAAMAACGTTPTPAWHDETGYRWRELDITRGTPGFTPMPEATTGVRFSNTVSDSALLGNRMLAQGAGIALGDVDGDGLVDVFLARTEGSSALYQNLGGWRFRDITDSAGVAAPGRNATGAALADTDGDGDLDLILLATIGPNALFVNDGRGRFTEHREDAGLAVGNGATTPTMADVDGDGDLDLYVANYKPNSPVDQITPQQRAPSQIVRQVGPGKFEVAPEHQRDFKLVMRPDMGGLNLSMRGVTDDFYLNEGGHFVPVPFPSDRFRDAVGKPLTTVEESFSLDARFADFNDDGAPDLYAANDFEDQDLLWINDGHGVFRRASWTAQRQTSNSGMGLDVGDVNGDGLPDLFETDMLSNDSRRLKTQMPTHTALPKHPGDIETQLQLQRNTLFLNRGDGTFGEVSAFAGIEASGWSWGTMFLDVDLDGWQDILVATGHAWDLMDADTQERLQNRLNDIAWQRQRWEYPTLPLKNVAFRNRGNLTFEDAGAAWRFGTEADISHALAAADLDGDGDLDVVVSRLRAPTLLLRNDAPAPRIAIRLRGDPPNTQGVGAKIRVEGGAIPVQVREVAAGGLYLSHSDYLASFATASADSVRIIVDWRDGRRTVIRGARPNRLYEISAATATPRPAGPAAASAEGPLFEDATAQLGGHTHSDPAFDDWQRQFLLPNALSQLGPSVTWFDLDRDGDEDLIVGTGKGGQIAVFRNNHGRLTPDPSPHMPAEADYTTILGLPGAGGSRLLAGVSNWEAASLADIMKLSPVLSLPLHRGRLVPPGVALFAPDTVSTGPLALGDYDGDGDLDLFVGGRAVFASYPRPASSALYRNDNGRFVADANSARILAGVGLVSAALFADIDGDGDADLLLAREWGSILLLINQGGRYTAGPESWGLDRWTSRWNGLTAGDLDGDGRLDLVATSWGRNGAMPADSARPLIALYGPFGSGGETELLLARTDTRLNALAPLNSFQRVRATIPSLVERVNSFGAYADAPVNRVLGADSTRVERLTAASLDHMMFLNRGNHFDAMPLPAEAQFAPAFYAGVADFDGDGAEDVFLSQNFFPTAIGLPRYDGGRGLLLKGDGKGGLAPMLASRSGIMIYGDQRGAAFSDFDADGRLDLAVSQNAAATRLLHNRGAKPGLRVRLSGPSGNPDGVGSQIRIVYGATMGPVREVQAGSGYWSENGAVQVFGRSGTPTAVWVRWPGGKESRVPVNPAMREVVVHH